MTEEIVTILKKYGIDPLYFSAILGLLISMFCFYYYSDKWEEIPKNLKHSIIIAYIGTTILVIISIVDYFSK